jgi:hypothetical protein
MRILRVHWGFARMKHDRRVVPLFRPAPHAGTGPVSVGNVALAGQPAVHRAPPWFPIDPESDTQPIPAVRLSMDWAADLGEPRDPAMAMDPGIGIEPDLDDAAFGLRPVTEPEPASEPAGQHTADPSGGSWWPGWSSSWAWPWPWP